MKNLSKTNKKSPNNIIVPRKLGVKRCYLKSDKIGQTQQQTFFALML